MRLVGVVVFALFGGGVVSSLLVSDGFEEDKAPVWCMRVVSEE